MKISKKSVGKKAVYHGFDGKDYECVISKVHCGVAIIDYAVNGGMVRAYVDKPFHSRIDIPAESA